MYWIFPYRPPLCITTWSIYQLKFNVQMKHTKQMNTFTSFRSLVLVWGRCGDNYIDQCLHSLLWLSTSKQRVIPVINLTNKPAEKIKERTWTTGQRLHILYESREPTGTNHELCSQIPFNTMIIPLKMFHILVTP